jgi:hypothetical protein
MNPVLVSRKRQAKDFNQHENAYRLGMDKRASLILLGGPRHCKKFSLQRKAISGCVYYGGKAYNQA